MVRRSRGTLGAVLMLAFGLVSCGPSSRTVEFSEKPLARGTLRVGLGDAERHGFRSGIESPFAGPQQPAAGPISWGAPAGWQAKAPTQFRAGSFAAPRGVDVSLSVLPGAAGGLRPNLDRWRSQMGLAPVSNAEFEQLGTASMLGEEALVVDCEGTYAPMKIESARMLGRMLTTSASGRMQTVFVKMVGESSAVTAQAEALESFCQGLSWNTGPMAAPPGGAPRSGAPSAPSTNSASTASSDQGQPVGAGRLGWELPESWTVAQSTSSMRLVTFHPNGDESTDAYIVILKGTAGGLKANFDRWLGQAGAPTLRADDLDSLPVLDVLGTSVPVLEAAGTAPTGILGLMAPLGSDSLFLKMVGPKERLAEHRAGFEAFARSLTVSDLEQEEGR
ncbi:MAG: hypothetical protein AAF196_15020 [Planctomycetota bacterium]